MNESNDEEDSLIFYICTFDYVPVSFYFFTISWLFLAMGWIYAPQAAVWLLLLTPSLAPCLDFL